MWPIDAPAWLAHVEMLSIKTRMPTGNKQLLYIRSDTTGSGHNIIGRVIRGRCIHWASDVEPRESGSSEVCALSGDDTYVDAGDVYIGQVMWSRESPVVVKSVRFQGMIPMSYTSDGKRPFSYSFELACYFHPEYKILDFAYRAVKSSFSSALRSSCRVACVTADKSSSSTFLGAGSTAAVHKEFATVFSSGLGSIIVSGPLGLAMFKYKSTKSPTTEQHTGDFVP